MLPTHIAIIPDGNRRWAKALGLDPWEGHREGVKRFEEIADEAYRLGVSYVTFWGASESNLIKRTKPEVMFLTALMREHIQKELESERFVKNRTRFRFLGNWRNYLQDTKLDELVKQMDVQTGEFSEKNLTILFGYSGKSEMLEAIEKLRGSSEPATDEGVMKALPTGMLPPVDLVIRTGGEAHWSAGFMMWHTADSQFYFTDEFWPAFTVEKFRAALDDFDSRERRFGK